MLRAVDQFSNCLISHFTVSCHFLTARNPLSSLYRTPSLIPNLQGSWSGKGLKKRKPNPKFLVKTAGVEATSRKDFGKDNVIISEKTEKKAKPFLAKDLPYPYTSVAQYEASFATPTGAEWNSRKVHQRETMPRVIKKVSWVSFWGVFWYLWKFGLGLCIHGMVARRSMAGKHKMSVYPRWLGDG